MLQQSPKYFFLLICLMMFGNGFLYAQEPIVRHIYTADPSARVFNDTLYVYPSHDKDDAKWFNMSDWHVFSTTDMKTWTDHGVIFSLDSISWASSLAWAPDCVQKNGRYYFYYPVEKKFIGVAVSDKPIGPFKDPLGKPLVSKKTPGVVANRGLIDPNVFIDDDSTAYLLFGQNSLNIVRLHSDMISFSDSVRVIAGTKKFFEAAWMFKREGKYYLMYASKPMLLGRAKIHYGICDHPLGSFQYKGVVLGKVSSGTNHASAVEFKGEWHLFYHNSQLFFEKNHGSKKFTRMRWYKRSVTSSPLIFNEDGSIKRLNVD